MRKPFLDNIRWMTVLLVLVYHVFYVFNAAGVPGGLGAFSPVQYQDVILYFVYPWFMVLLFTVSGICSRYSLEKRGRKAFFRDRTRKLLVPSTLGLFAFQWSVGYFNALCSGALEKGGFMQEIPPLISYLIFAVSGIGPLWFIQVLWLFSLLLCLVSLLDRNDRFYIFCGKCTWPCFLAFSLLIWGSAQILNAPVITTYRFGIYLTAFLLGYFVFSHEDAQESVAKMRYVLLPLALVIGVCYTIYYFGQNYASDACLKSLFTNVYAWIAVLAILGGGKARLNKTTAFSRYMSKTSFGIYIVHYLLILAPCFWMKNNTALPPCLIYLFAILIVLAGSPALYELLRRIPVVRYAVLGIQGEKRKRSGTV